ncbi:MAG: hypothetical protein FRX48_02786 [Lasallia pustulata]|uniref:Uncharacterized protein n=1 Tax=Lasallia pustulata TaxID=136370 RepID=A0A5M8PWF4_9LECA|nr:MAG: hypothetical protein FRX48_02786 [Lasallia pustulata]
MAFRQPTFAPPQRQVSIASEQHLQTTLSPYQQSALDDSQEWVLFSPTQASSTTRTQTTSSERTPRTAGLSRLSDFGSLHTAAKSSGDGEQASEDADVVLDDDEDLNSLDDGLHAFREPSVYQSSRRVEQSGDTILPTHDGLGSFPASSSPVQEQLWQFEQYNPLKTAAGHHRRRSSVQRRLDAVEDGNEAQVERVKMERIEQWRMEQSKVLLDEIEKETRRRRMSRTQDTTASIASMAEEGKVTTCDNNDAGQSSAPEKPEESESFWQRITRRVIRDLMGIDESLLSVIFGETLPSDGGHHPQSSVRLATAQAKPLEASLVSELGGSWEDRLLERLARELGILVHQLSEHPGAFSTYPNSSTIDYAGIPVTRSSTPRPTAEPSITKEPEDTTSMIEPDFPPTLQDRRTSASTQAALWGIEEEDPPGPSSTSDPDYWERRPDIKTIFRFLHHRFISHRRATSTTATKQPNLATAHTPDSLRRAAIIRQHHPLVSRATASYDRSPSNRRSTTLLHHRHSSPILSSTAQFRRSGSSCASLSTRKSKRGGGAGSGSSRNYWDLGGSVGSGSAVAALGGMGAWGEL